MLRTLRSSIATGLVLGVLGPAAIAEAELKVGFVDPRRAVMSSARGREGEEILAKLVDQKKKQMEPREKEFRRLTEELEAQKFVLSKDALEERQIEVVKLRRDLEREMQEAQEDLQIEERKMLAPLLKDLEAAIREVGKDKSFDLILDRSNAGVLYYEDGLDVTDLVIKRLNEGNNKGN